MRLGVDKGAVLARCEGSRDRTVSTRPPVVEVGAYRHEEPLGVLLTLAECQQEQQGVGRAGLAAAAAAAGNGGAGLGHTVELQQCVKEAVAQVFRIERGDKLAVGQVRSFQNNRRLVLREGERLAALLDRAAGAVVDGGWARLAVACGTVDVEAFPGQPQVLLTPRAHRLPLAVALPVRPLVGHRGQRVRVLLPVGFRAFHGAGGAVRPLASHAAPWRSTFVGPPGRPWPARADLF